MIVLPYGFRLQRKTLEMVIIQIEKDIHKLEGEKRTLLMAFNSLNSENDDLKEKPYIFLQEVEKILITK